VICNYAAMTSMVKTLGVFRTETALITRERAAGLYSVRRTSLLLREESKRRVVQKDNEALII